MNVWNSIGKRLKGNSCTVCERIPQLCRTNNTKKDLSIVTINNQQMLGDERGKFKGRVAGLPNTS